MAKSTGKLHGDLCARNGVARDEFEDLLNAMGGAGFVRIEDASFEKDGRTIAYRKASLTHEGEEFSDSDADTIVLRELAGEAAIAAPARAGRKRASRLGASGGAGASRSRVARGRDEDEPLSVSGRALEEKLRAWRKAESAKIGQPAFCVFPDKTLRAIAAERPVSEDDLLAISGVGPAKAAKFGAAVCRICSAG
jgi:superfamily II DNA helicase RecQ